ncbi:MAG: formylmethanofuran dehydrogenase subunit A [Propylenella sp.]
MIRLQGGRVIDPKHSRDGIGDVWIDGERIIEAPPDGRATDTYDLGGKIIMAGAIDIHSHIASANVNIARLMLPERHGPSPLSADMTLDASTLSTFENGIRYAEMGYTLVVEPAVNPSDALHAHIELALTPVIDRGLLLLLGNEDFLLGMLRDREGESAVADYVATVLSAGWGLGVKVVNAGGAAAFKSNVRSFSLDDEVPEYGVTSRAILLALQKAVHDLAVSHPLHVHCNNLGLPGNADTAEATMEAAGDLPMHLAHLQFYGYGKEGKRGFSSAAARLAERANASPNVTIDVGQVMFGPTVTVSSDTLRQFAQRRFAKPKKSTVWDAEGNGGGIVPVVYGERDFFSALQWAIGLELFLLIDDPWQVYFTTDHPNGAPFVRYPEILHLLMDAEERARWMERLPKSAMEMTTLGALKREYSLYDVATMTRAAPARLLGLADRGHLGPGALADIAVYEDIPDRTATFRRAHLVFKSGALVVRDGVVVNVRWGRTLGVHPPAPKAMRKRLTRYHDETYGYPLERLDVREAAVATAAGLESVFEEVACRQS